MLDVCLLMEAIELDDKNLMRKHFQAPKKYICVLLLRRWLVEEGNAFVGNSKNCGDEIEGVNFKILC